MRELELIRLIDEAFQSGQGPGVEVGIGDDAAVLTLAAGEKLVVTTDAQVEHVHFDRRWLGAHEIGGRAVEVALSDLAAMGARARGLTLSIAARAGDEALPHVISGFAAQAGLHGCPVVGGNVSSASELSLTVTALGAIAPGRRALLRHGARPGDIVFVTGPLGGAALGLALLAAGSSERRTAPEAAAITRWRSPRARMDLAETIGELASAALDVSDGLAQDLDHLAEASGVAIRVEAARVPTLPAHVELATQLGRDPVMLALTGGEDYELAFTATPAQGARAMAFAAIPIGTVTAGHGVAFVDAEGTEIVLPVRGWQHL